MLYLSVKLAATMIEEIPDWERPQTTRDFPRWPEIAVGIILGSFTLFTGYASLVMLFSINRKTPLLVSATAILLVWGCAWVLEKSVRLLTGRNSQAAVFSPAAFRVISYAPLLLITIALFTGYFRTASPTAIYEAAIHLSIFVGLHRWARYRESHPQSAPPRVTNSNLS
jgi:hypothetical protein